MARITWQNVAAPDFGAAIAGQRTAGDILGRAVEDISGALFGIDARSKNEASAAAISRALQVRDVAEWDKLLSEKGLAGLGITPDRATPELLSFLQGYREDIVSDRQDDYDFNRTNILDSRNDQAYALDQAARAINLEGQQRAQQIAQGTNSREEAERAILNLGLGTQQEQATLAALGNQPGSRWQSLPQEFSPEVRQTLTTTRDGLTARQREQDIQFKSSPALQLWTDGIDRYEGSSNVGESLIKRVSDYAGTQGNDTDKGEFREATGEIQKEFNRLKGKFPQLPESLVAAALESNIQATGFGWVWDDDVTFNTSAAEKQLASMDTESERLGLESIRADYLNQRQTLDSQRKRLDKAEQDLALALTRGQSGDKERKKIFDLQKEFAGTAAPSDPARDLIGSFRSSPPAPQSEQSASGNAPSAINPLFSNDEVRAFQDAGEQYINTRIPTDDVLTPTADPVPTQTAPQPTAPNGVNAQVAAQDPVSTIAAVTQEAGLPPETSQQAQVIVAALQQGRDPQTGRPLSQQETVQLRRQLAAVIDQARRSYQGSGSGDPIADLLAQPEIWLRF